MTERACAGDYRYGLTCPMCAEPKTKQALRCRRCYADERRTFTVRVQRPQFVCSCGRPCWTASRVCRLCWVPSSNADDHPWRGRTLAA